MAGITHHNRDSAACVDSLLAAAFGSPGRVLSASEAREQLQALAQLVVPMPDSLSDPVTTKGADGPYALALDEHPRVAKELEVRASGSDFDNATQALASRPGFCAVVSEPCAAEPPWCSRCRCDARQHYPGFALGARLGQDRGGPRGRADSQLADGW